MKATAIRAGTFLALESLDLELPAKISVFVGRNGAGKSSILDVVRATLVGSARGVPRKDSKALAKWGEKNWFGEVDFSDGDASGTLRRTPSTLVAIDEDGVKHTLTQKKIDGILAPVRTLEAVFDVWKALDMSSSDRKELVFAIAGIEFDAEFLVAGGIDDEEVLEAIISKGWKKGEAIASEKKRALGRALDENRVAKPEDAKVGEEGSEMKLSEISDDVLADCRSGIEHLRDDAAKLSLALGRKGDSGSLTQEKEELEATASREGKMREKMDGLLANIKDLRPSIVDAKKTIKEEGEKIREAEERIYVFGGRLKSDEPEDLVACPNCGHEFDPSPKTGEDREAIKVGIVVAKQCLERSSLMAASAREARTTLSRELSGYEVERDRLTLELRKAVRAKDRLEDIGKLLRESEEPAGTEADLEAIRTRIAVGENIVRQATAYRDASASHEEAIARRKRVSKKQAHLEKIEKLCRPDGLPSKLLAPTLVPIRDRLAEISPKVFDAGEEIQAVILTDDFEPLVVDRSGVTHELRTMNESIKWRVGFLLSDALAHLSGLRFLALDETTLLDAENRGALFGALLEVADSYDQVLLAAVQGSEEPSQFPPEVEDALLYLVRDGEVRLASVRDE